ncbi:MAG: beta-galactosidase, partial [candidate division KSB1 bacterium]|nr:beta-galactosidase [candidate division KSB1 bacterium]
MLYPQNNRYRTVLDLSGFWEIKADPDHVGVEKNWNDGFEADAYVGVPGSWNEQLAEIGLMNYVGPLWHQTRFFVPSALSEKTLLLRFGSADFHARVWVNGEYVGEHEGGFLPFEFDITSFVNQDNENLLVVCVDNTLTYDTIPQGLTKDDFVSFRKNRDASFPPTAFDFFAYGGLHRPVKLVALHPLHLSEVKVDTAIAGTTGHIKFEATFSRLSEAASVEISLWDGRQKLEKKIKPCNHSTIAGEFAISRCQFWCPENPHLYQLRFAVQENGTPVDEYQVEVGVREITVAGAKLLLNGEPIFLKGFGKHEDFAVLGKGLSHPLIVKDFQLMKWIGANSFRTSHYPYAEEIMQMADRMGFLIIDEAPAVSLNFRHVTPKTLENHKRALTELIARDRNHPAVIGWSIANEPGIWGEEEAISEKAENYWAEICRHVKSLDSTRPITLPAFAFWKERDPAYKYSDFISINRYWGWYEIPGEIEEAGATLKAEME